MQEEKVGMGQTCTSSWMSKSSISGKQISWLYQMSPTRNSLSVQSTIAFERQPISRRKPPNVLDEAVTDTKSSAGMLW
jgi:hypothetical protein